MFGSRQRLPEYPSAEQRSSLAAEQSLGESVKNERPSTPPSGKRTGSGGDWWHG